MEFQGKSENMQGKTDEKIENVSDYTAVNINK
jgi:hypothetical protein